MPVLRNNATRSKVIRGLLIGQFVFLALIGALLFVGISRIHGQDLGTPNFENIISILVAIDLLSIVGTILNVLTVVFFTMWFKRAYYNIHQITEAKYNVKWAAGAWFVPLMNLTRPKQIMIEIWQKTQSYSMPEKQVHKNILIHGWWNFFIFGHFLNFYALLLQLRAKTTTDALSVMQLSFIGMVVFGIAAIIVFIIVQRLAKFEKILYENLHEIDITDHLIG